MGPRAVPFLEPLRADAEGLVPLSCWLLEEGKRAAQDREEGPGQLALPLPQQVP